MGLPAKKPSDIEVNEQTLKMLMQTPTVPERYRESSTGANDMLAVYMWGRELGVGFWTSIYELFLVNGQSSMQGKLMLALVWRAGHKITVDIDETSSTIHCWRREEGVLEHMGDVTFDVEDATRAGLIDKDTYVKYPKSMLTWRAVSLASRIYYPDVLLGMGVYVPEEVNIISPIEPVPEGVVVNDDGSLEMERALMNAEDVLEAVVVED